MLILTLKSSFVAALTISTIARLVAYAVTCAALPVLRRKSDAAPAHFKLRGGVVIAIEIPSGAAVAGPFDIPQPALDRLISSVLASSSPNKTVVH